MKIKDWDRSLKVRLIGEAFMNITFWMFFPFLAIYFAEEFGKSTAGLLLVVSQVFSVAANLIGGYCADRFGRRTMMIISSYGQGAAFLLFAFANSPILTSPILGFIAFSIAGVFGSFYWPASEAMVADVVPEKYRSDVFAIFYTMHNIAVVIGPILGGIFFFKYRFGLIVTAAFVCIALGFVLYKFAHETLPIEMSLKMKEKASGMMAAISTQIKDYGVILQDKLFMLFIVSGILIAQTFMQLDLLLPVYSMDVIGEQSLGVFFGKEWIMTGESAFGFIISQNGLIVALFTVWITRIMLGFKEKNVFFCSSIFYAISMLIFASTNYFFVFIIAMTLFTLAEIMVTGIQQSFISKLAPEHMRGQYFAAASLRYTIGRMIAPMSIPMAVWVGYYWTFIILAVIAVISACLYYYMFHLFARKTH
ncbi:MFS transporter [Viridibacillus sp. YIM B01967]|uniref:MFS transporter n=1 Tax=Viridibacillus soli TaxID=2798301 RepID=A0ABS1H7G1_9BACL|nr:MFS transporter [Viridibacillus soli]MBK3495343.1 MFS transporter [Viridibacillus soli]